MHCLCFKEKGNDARGTNSKVLRGNMLLVSSTKSTFVVCKALILKRSGAQFSGYTYYEIFYLRFPCLQEIHQPLKLLKVNKLKQTALFIIEK